MVCHPRWPPALGPPEPLLRYPGPTPARVLRSCGEPVVLQSHGLQISSLQGIRWLRGRRALQRLLSCSWGRDAGGQTRAVNRALRKAYGIGLCSVEEIGSFPAPTAPARATEKVPAGAGGNSSGNGQPRLRDRLCQLIRQHQLDPTLVKRYAADFCGTETLREASRDLVEGFVNHLAESAAKDRAGLLCQLNSYAQPQEAKS